MREQQPFWRGLRAWVGYQQSAFQYERKLRQAGETKYTLRKMVSLAGDALVGFSLQPLRLATALGAATTAVALLAAVVVALVYAAGGSDGPLSESATLVNSLLALAILFLGGVQLVCLGILGEYVGRIFENVKGRPRYIVREPAIRDATRRRAA
jgi:dolichol-phosphate mannosyltransferase